PLTSLIFCMASVALLGALAPDGPPAGGVLFWAEPGELEPGELAPVPELPEPGEPVEVDAPAPVGLELELLDDAAPSDPPAEV
ncbi:hypothetical protein ACTXIU_18460, partial [Glutamicibacter arilaitensis]